VPVHPPHSSCSTKEGGQLRPSCLTHDARPEIAPLKTPVLPFWSIRLLCLHRAGILRRGHVAEFFLRHIASARLPPPFLRLTCIHSSVDVHSTGHLGRSPPPAATRPRYSGRHMRPFRNTMCNTHSFYTEGGRPFFQSTATQHRRGITRRPPP
jgi:hypothetical protein